MANSSVALSCRRSRWQNREAYLLRNGCLSVMTLTGGGHIGRLSLNSVPNMNALWNPPWRTIDPHLYDEKLHAHRFGTITEGKLLSGLVGHNICLDHFGTPSKEEAHQGLSEHGEAPSVQWKVNEISKSKKKIALRMSAELPMSGLRFNRKIELRENEAIAYFEEGLHNEKKRDHFFHWTQHVTLGDPFLSSKHARIVIPGSKAITYPYEYEQGKGLLACNRRFRWPNAPTLRGGEADLTRPFIYRGLGFVVSVLLRKRQVGFIAAINPQCRLVLLYCFRRFDFPWVAVWEENCGNVNPPWLGRTRARGLEFGTTPLPLPRTDAFQAGRLFGETTFAHIPALGTKTVRYAALLARTPIGFKNVTDIKVREGQILIYDSVSAEPLVVEASGIMSLLD